MKANAPGILICAETFYDISLRLRYDLDAGADDSVLRLKSLEALEKVADGKSTKIIIPSEIQNMAGLLTSAKELLSDK